VARIAGDTGAAACQILPVAGNAILCRVLEAGFMANARVINRMVSRRIDGSRAIDSVRTFRAGKDKYECKRDKKRDQSSRLHNIPHFEVCLSTVNDFSLQKKEFLNFILFIKTKKQPALKNVCRLFLF
jgi:hypothetical protein